MAARPASTTRIGVAAAALVGGLVVAAIIVGVGPSLVAALPLASLGPAGGEAAFTLLIFGPLLLAGVIGGLLCGERAWRAGERPGAMAAAGAALGAVGLFGATGLAAVAGTARLSAGGSVSLLLLAGAAVVAVQVAAEEVFFRGWLQPVVARATGTPTAIAVVAVAFAALHGVARWPGTLGPGQPGARRPVVRLAGGARRRHSRRIRRARGVERVRAVVARPRPQSGCRQLRLVGRSRPDRSGRLGWIGGWIERKLGDGNGVAGPAGTARPPLVGPVRSRGHYRGRSGYGGSGLTAPAIL